MPEKTPPDEVRNCPDCANPLTRVHRFGFHVDQCPEHGVWIEKELLDDYLRHARRPSLRRSRRAQKNARRRGVIQGSFFGWAALLFDG